MTTPTLSTTLRENPWFAALTDAHFEKLLGIATEKSWQAGQTIFREGDEDRNLYLILTGRVALDIYVPVKGRVTILTLGENELFGWSAALPVVNIKTATARAVQDTHTVIFDAVELRKLSEMDHSLGYQIYRRLTNVIAGRLTATRLQLLDMYAVGLEEKGR